MYSQQRSGHRSGPRSASRGSHGSSSHTSRGAHAPRGSFVSRSGYSSMRPAHAAGTASRTHSASPARPNFRSGSRGQSFSTYKNGRGFSRGGQGGRGGSRQRSFSDLSKFINKVSTVEQEAPYVAKHEFTDFNVDERVKNNIVAKGYKNPTPIQDQSIPHVLEGKDIVGIANTGTGKTAAFLIPLIDKVLNARKEKREEYVLIVVPTRELALQIQSELAGFTPGLNIHSGCCVGGAPLGRQISGLRTRPNFVIGTPGRLKDLMDRRSLRLEAFSTIVLDEADRMLDMGFINDMRFLMSHMPQKRHTLFFSATLSPDIAGLISQFLNNPVSISVKTRDTSKNIDQDVVRVNPGQHKIEVLHDVLTQEGVEKVLIFGKTKHGVERLSNELITRGFSAESIHGDKNHAKRQKALKSFKENQSKILVATDVAARGIDIADVSHVINYDLPATYEDYVHRIGRTGRGGKMGKALTFIEQR